MFSRAITALVVLATILYVSHNSKPTAPIPIAPPPPCHGCRGID